MLYSLLLYAGVLLFVGGIAVRVARWLRTPARLPLVLTPAPTTRAGVLARVAANVALIPALMRADKVLWLFGWTFHGALALVILGHVSGIGAAGLHFTLFGLSGDQSRALSSVLGLVVGWIFVAAIVGLAARRVLFERMRAITGPPAYAVLGLVAAVCTTGMFLRTRDVDLAAVRAFLVQTATFSSDGAPADAGGWLLALHFTLVMVLLSVFPYSRLLHACGIFLNPTIASVDAGRRNALDEGAVQ